MNAKRARRLSFRIRNNQVNVVYSLIKDRIRKAIYHEGALKVEIILKEIISEYDPSRKVLVEYAAEWLRNDGYDVELLDSGDGWYWKMIIEW